MNSERELRLKFTGDATSLVDAQRQIERTAMGGAEAEKKLRQAIGETSQELQRRAGQSSPQSGTGEGSDKRIKANESVLESDKRVQRQLSALVKDLAVTGNVMDAVAISADRLGDTFKNSLGVGVAIAVGVSLKRAIEERAAEMNKLSDAAAEVFKQKDGGASKSMEQLSAETTKATATADAYSKEILQLETTWGSFKNNAVAALAGPLGSLFGVKSTANHLEDLRGTLAGIEAELVKRNNELAEKEGQRADIAEKIALSRNSEAEQMQRLVNNAQELGKYDGASQQAAIAAVERRQAAEADLAQTKREAGSRELQTQSEILQAQREGNDAEVKAAEATLKAKKETARIAAERSNDPSVTGAAAEAAFAAQTALNAAVRARDIHNEDAALQLKIAGLTGETDQKHMRALSMEMEVLRARAATASEDEKRGGLTQRMAVIQMELDAATKLKGVRDAETAIRSNAGRTAYGPSDELEKTREQLKLQDRLLVAKMNSGNYSKEEVQSMAAGNNQLQKQIELKQAELVVTNAQNVAADNILTIEGSAQSEASKRYKITQQQIAAVNAEIAAMGSLNTELATAARLRKRGLENDLQRQDESANLGKSEKEIRDRLRGEQRDQRKLENFREKRERDQGLINPSRDMGGNVTGGTNPITGDKETRAAPDPFASLKPRGEQQGPHLKPGQDPSRDEAFRDQFKTAKDRAAGKEAKAEQGAQQGADNKKGGDNAVVTELKEIKADLKKAIMT